MITKALIFGVMAMVLVSCTHTGRDNRVVMKISETEAHVRNGDGELAVGDKITLYEQSCIRDTGDYDYAHAFTVDCERKELGQAEVMKNLGRNHSVVKVMPGAKFEEGTKFEIVRGQSH